MSAANAADLEAFKRLGILPELLETAQIRRVTDAEARDDCGIRYRADHLAGIWYPNIDPEHGFVRGGRVRRDHPERGADGKLIAKYVGPPDRHYLYFAPGAGALLADPSVSVVVVEAEKSALALTAAATRIGRRLLAIATGGCWGWKGTIGKTTDAEGARVDEKGPLPDLDRIVRSDRDVVLLFDANAATNQNVQAARRALARDLSARGARVRIAELPTEADINGADDYIGTHGDAALFGLLDAAKPSGRPPKKEKRDKPKQGRAVQLEDPEPWPDPVDGTALLDTIAATFERYLALPKHASTTLTLWVLHAYAFQAWFVSPFLAITSPVKRCGKTLLLIVLGALVPRRLFASNVTPAVLFRTIEKYGPTLLIDEADTFVRDNEELRGVLNSGHTKTTAVVIRTVGDDHDPRAFSTWCPKAIALIGRLFDTLADRAIEIRMRRRMAGERVERLRQDRIEGECCDLRRQAARWANDHLSGLQDADPQVPAALHDRAADCWRPLLAIADVAGGSWSTQAREAAKALSGVTDDADQPVSILLLADLRRIMLSDGGRALWPTQELTTKLRAIEDRPWATWGKTEKGLTGHALARMLRPFGVFATSDGAARGYRANALTEAWQPYLPPGEVSECQNINNSGVKSPFSNCQAEYSADTSKTAETAISTGLPDALTLREGENGDDEANHADDWRDPEELETGDVWTLR